MSDSLSRRLIVVAEHDSAPVIYVALDAVVEALREAPQAEYKGQGLGARAADFIQREFGGRDGA